MPVQTWSPVTGPEVGRPSRHAFASSGFTLSVLGGDCYETKEDQEQTEIHGSQTTANLHTLWLWLAVS